MSKIDIESIYKEVQEELTKAYLNDFHKFVVEDVAKAKEEGKNNERQTVILTSGVAQTLKNHSERLTITILQKVVDQLQSEK